MESIQLLAVDSESIEIPVSLEVVDRGEIALRLKVSNKEWRSFPGADLFKCLLDARVELEKEGMLLCCQGARPDVFPSGMQQQMELGRYAAVLGGSEEEVEIVDIFAAADSSQVASVESQRAFVYRFFNLPDVGSGKYGSDS
ncbi:hypothetical protein [Crossiella sp. CA198]|uniref:hypothetical protein n=1 Tax=Crossiella sp. CA198 TaxID=3455607 RepID=UPI003F8D68F7